MTQQAFPTTAVAARDGSETNAELMRVLEEYLSELERGVPPHPEELLARHPDLAEPLSAYLASLEFLHRAAAKLRSGDAPVPTSSAHGKVPELGQLGDYRIIREIARGGMGVVYEAEQVSLGRRVALKILPFAAALDQKRLQRFKNEAHAAAQLHHTNIVPVYAVGAERGVHYYAMQFIDGQTLAAMIADLRGHTSPTRQRGPSSLSSNEDATKIDTSPVAAISTDRPTRDSDFFRTVAQLGIQAAEALEYAHSMGIIHRDIKPGNLLLDLRGNLWITDFGLAQFQKDTDLTMTGDLLGTLRYMSPEQALAKRVIVDHRTDIYSLGVTLYELLTLEPAFNGKDRQEILRQIAFEEPKSLRRINKAIPAELETIVLKAMAKSPDERYGTAQEMEEDLRRWLEHKPIRATRPGVVQRVRKFVRRHENAVTWAVLASFIGLIMTSMTLGFGMFKSWRSQQRIEAERDAQIAAKKESELALYLARRFFAEQRLHSRTDKGILALGWDYLRHWPMRFIDCETISLPGHATGCTGLAYSRDGRLIATGQGYNDGTVKIWDATTAKELQSFRHEKGAGVVDFDSTGQRVACTAYGFVAIRDLDTGHEVGAHFRRPDRLGAGNIVALGGVFSVAFSPDGQRVASAGLDGNVLISNALNSFDQVFEMPGYFAAAWSPDGRYIASGVHRPGRGLETVVTVYDADSRKQAMTLQQHFATVSALAFSPDGRHLASGGWDGYVWVGDLIAGKVIKGWPASQKPFYTGIPNPDWQTSLINCVAYSPDGAYLASAGFDGTIRIWNAKVGQLGQLVARIDGRMGPIYRVAFSPDGQHLAASGGYHDQGIVKIWDKNVWEKK